MTIGRARRGVGLISRTSLKKRDLRPAACWRGCSWRRLRELSQSSSGETEIADSAAESQAQQRKTVSQKCHNVRPGSVHVASPRESPKSCGRLPTNKETL